MDIPAGYQLHVTTWENDADAYNTEIFSGLTETDVKFLLSIAKKFVSKNNSRNGLGNGGVPSKKLLKVVNDALKKFPDVSQKIRDDFTVDEDTVWEAITEILGYPVSEYYWEEENFCRVFDRYEVFLIETPIKDVSAQFK